MNTLSTSSPTAPGGMVTLVFTDIVSSTAMKSLLPGADATERNRAYFESILTPHRRRVEANLAARGGRVVKTEGDAYFLVFADPAQAAQWLAELQQEHRDDPIATPLGALQITSGAHTGNPLADGDDFIGQEVDYAARVASLATGGQVALSEATAALVRSASITGLELHPHGERDLKGIGRAPVYELLYGGKAPQPLKVAAQAPCNLPVPQTPFIGREGEIADWGEILRQPTTRLLTLTGFGGLGKTRSALQLAALCAHDWAGKFPDGVWWVELAETRDGDGMLQRIAYALDFAIQPPPTAREQILGFLRGRRVLLALDNLEQIPDAGAVVGELLTAAPGLKCLVTSRRALELQAERCVEVPPLPPDTARQLFTERARARQSDFVVDEANRAAVDELCRRLEGVPLALELAASRAALLSPAEMLERLGERFRLLQSRAPDLPPRQRALRGAIDWSYELLGDEDRALFAQLAVFRGGFTMDDVEAVCEVFDPLEGLAELRRHSLLRAASGDGAKRFVMLEALRDYAAEKLDEAPGGDGVRRRHAQRFLKLARQHMAKLRTPGEAAALRQLEADFENARGAQEWCRAAGESAQASEYALLLGRFLQRRGFLREAVRQIESGLQSAPSLPGGSALLTELQLERAGLHLDAFEEEATQQVLQQVLARCEQAGDARGQATAHNLLGLARRDARDAAGAQRHFATALENYRQAGDDLGAAIVLNNLGLTEDEAGERDAAARHLEEALSLRRKHGDSRGVAETATNLGVQAQELERLQEAGRFYEEALGIEQALGYTFGVARALSNLGEIAEWRGDLRRACRLFAAAARLFDEAGSPYQKYCADLLQSAAPRAGLDDAALTQLRHDARDKTLDELVAWSLDTKR